MTRQRSDPRQARALTLPFKRITPVPEDDFGARRFIWQYTSHRESWTRGWSGIRGKRRQGIVELLSEIGRF